MGPHSDRLPIITSHVKTHIPSVDQKQNLGSGKVKKNILGDYLLFIIGVQ